MRCRKALSRTRGLSRFNSPPASPDSQLTDPQPKTNKPRRERKPPVFRSDEQLLALLELAWKDSRRNHCLILVTYWHGLRASETVNLRFSDFDLAQSTVRIRRGEGSEGGEHPLQVHDNFLLDERAAFEWWIGNQRFFGVKGGAWAAQARSRKSKQCNAVVYFPSERLFPIGRLRFWQIVREYALAAWIPARKCKTHTLKHLFRIPDYY